MTDRHRRGGYNRRPGRSEVRSFNAGAGPAPGCRAPATAGPAAPAVPRASTARGARHDTTRPLFPAPGSRCATPAGRRTGTPGRKRAGAAIGDQAHADRRADQHGQGGQRINHRTCLPGGATARASSWAVRRHASTRACRCRRSRRGSRGDEAAGLGQSAAERLDSGVIAADPGHQQVAEAGQGVVVTGEHDKEDGAAEASQQGVAIDTRRSTWPADASHCAGGGTRRLGSDMDDSGNAKARRKAGRNGRSPHRRASARFNRGEFIPLSSHSVNMGKPVFIQKFF